jgi:hypothetical protein
MEEISDTSFLSAFIRAIRGLNLPPSLEMPAFQISARTKKMDR